MKIGEVAYLWAHSGAQMVFLWDAKYGKNLFLYGSILQYNISGDALSVVAWFDNVTSEIIAEKKEVCVPCVFLMMVCLGPSSTLSSPNPIF